MKSGAIVLVPLPERRRETRADVGGDGDHGADDVGRRRARRWRDEGRSPGHGVRSYGRARRARHRPGVRSRSAHRLMTRAAGSGYVSRPSASRAPTSCSPSRSRRSSVVQVLVWPLASRPLGVAIALGLDAADRVAADATRGGRGGRRRCRGAIPTDGYVFVGFVAALRPLLLARRARRRDLRLVIAITALGVALGSSRLVAQPRGPGRVHGRGDRGRAAGAWSGGVVRRQQRAARAPAELSTSASGPRSSRSPRSGRGSRASCTTSSPTALERDRDPGRRRRGRARPRPASSPARPLAAIAALGRAGAGRDAAAARRAARGRRRRPTLAPQPGLAELPRWSSAPAPPGCRSTLRVDGEPRALPAGARPARPTGSSRRR